MDAQENMPQFSDDLDRLGRLLIDRKIIDEQALAEALADQQQSHLPLGQILVRNGAMDAETLRAALGDQGALRSGFFRLGDLLLRLGLVDDNRLAWALEQQRTTGQMLGKLLVDAGILTIDTLRQSLILQSKLRRRIIASVLVVAIAAQPFTAAAGELLGGAQPDQTIELVVHVPDAMNVTRGLSLGLPGDRAVDRVRLLQPLMPYRQTADTVMIQAMAADGGSEFVLSRPGAIGIPVSLRLMLDPTQDLVDLHAKLAATVPARTSANSHVLEVSFDAPSLESLSPGDYATTVHLVVTPL